MRLGEVLSLIILLLCLVISGSIYYIVNTKLGNFTIEIPSQDVNLKLPSQDVNIQFPERTVDLEFNTPLGVIKTPIKIPGGNLTVRIPETASTFHTPEMQISLDLRSYADKLILILILPYILMGVLALAIFGAYKSM